MADHRARIESEPRLVPSLITRLLDDAPGNSREDLHERFYKVSQMKVSVAHDLEELLNTRRDTLIDIPAELTEVSKSLLTYGLPDFTAYNLLDPGDCNRIKRSLENAIAWFEPRLQRVRVSMQTPDRYDRALRFQIEAILKIEPAEEAVAFDTVLHLETQAFSVRSPD